MPRAVATTSVVPDWLGNRDFKLKPPPRPLEGLRIDVGGGRTRRSPRPRRTQQRPFYAVPDGTGKDRDTVDETPLTEEECAKIASEALQKVFDKTFKENPELHTALRSAMAPKSRKDFQTGITILISAGRAWSEALTKMLATYEIVQARHPDEHLKKTFAAAIAEMREIMEKTLQEGKDKFIPAASILEQLSRDLSKE